MDPHRDEVISSGPPFAGTAVLRSATTADLCVGLVAVVVDLKKQHLLKNAARKLGEKNA